MPHDFARPLDVAIIGAGSIGIAVAYYLVRRHGVRSIALIDPRDPLSFTSAQSGENYRNWWPHPVMTAFTDHSTTLLEELDRLSPGRIAMTRGGYALATRSSSPDEPPFHRASEPPALRLLSRRSGRTGRLILAGHII